MNGVNDGAIYHLNLFLESNHLVIARMRGIRGNLLITHFRKARQWNRKGKILDYRFASAGVCCVSNLPKLA
ncbi:hypothetical protein [Helicobacter rodentium]|uniref:hypothetical protein n=1 Tax=Helicobacter rodentium TaxID=59617 RepID=UPI002357873F|nr:hypothetical protein [Helicobacter rodentium]